MNTFNCEDLQLRDESIQVSDGRILTVPPPDFQAILQSMLKNLSWMALINDVEAHHL